MPGPEDHEPLDQRLLSWDDQAFSVLLGLRATWGDEVVEGDHSESSLRRYHLVTSVLLPETPVACVGSGRFGRSAVSGLDVVQGALLADRPLRRGRHDVEDFCLRVRHISGAVDLYLALGCDVRLADDGWVRMGQGNVRFVLIQGWSARDAHSPVLGLTSPDLTRLCLRLRALGIAAGPITHTATAPSGRIVVRDPDRHTVVISHAPAGGFRKRIRPSTVGSGLTPMPDEA
jgi:hypothetical protein